MQTETERNNRIRQLRAEGWTLQALADEYKLSRQRVHIIVLNIPYVRRGRKKPKGGRTVDLHTAVTPTEKQLIDNARGEQNLADWIVSKAKAP
jgi:hypothetical protein